MKTTIDVQTLLGFVSATGLPAVFKAIIGFLHPSLYTIFCGIGYVDKAPSCYADDRAEALLWLGLTVIAVAYGAYTLWQRLSSNPTPPSGMTSSIIAKGEIPVTINRDGTEGIATAKALPGTVAEPTVIVPAAAAASPPA
jgi:hypothetical protein